MLTPRAILIDLDNTLFHWDPCDHEARVAAHGLLAQQVDVTFEQFMQLHREARQHFKHALHNQGSSHNRVLYFKFIVEKLVDRPRPALVLAMFHCYWRTFFSHMRPQPDAHRVLEALSGRYPLAMLSNHTTDIQLEKVTRLGFEDHFAHIITSEETGVEKPDPRIFELALKRLKVKACDAVMVGDHATGDIQGAHDAGIATIHSREFTPGESPDGAADFTISRLVEVLDLIAVD